MPGHALEIAHVPTRKALQVFALISQLDRQRPAERRPTFLRIGVRVFRIGPRRRAIMNSGAEEQNALSFADGFSDGVEIVHWVSGKLEGEIGRASCRER